MLEDAVSRWLAEDAAAAASSAAAPAAAAAAGLEASIEVDGLTKSFGEFVADDAVSFKVFAGETYGLLGPNGAGKTTLLRMLTTLLRPDSGTARIRGHDLVHERGAVRRAIGTVSQAVTTDENLTVYENLSVQGKMYGLWGRDLRARIARRLAEVGLSERANQLAGKLSGGMRRRLEIARGVLHSPRVLFLDEPTTGLDPQSRRAIWDLIFRMKREDADLSILLTTHAMDEADFLCDRLAILDRGRILCEDSPEALKRGLATGERVSFELDRPIDPQERSEIERLGAMNWRQPVERVVEFQARPGKGVGRRAAQILEERGYRIQHLTIAPVTLEDVFFAYTGRELRES
jgi:ABC-2 type transport system ATP-binding protein